MLTSKPFKDFRLSKYSCSAQYSKYGLKRSNSDINQSYYKFNVPTKRPVAFISIRNAARRDSPAIVMSVTPPLKVLRDALRTGNARELRELCKTQPDALILNSGPGRSAAFEAAEDGHWDVLDVILQAGGSNSAQNGYGRTAIMEAAKNGHVDCVRILARHGADVNVTNKNTWTPTLYAASEGHAEVISLLHSLGADINAQMKDGSTPAIMAAKGSHLEALRTLMELNADLQLVRADGKSAIQIHCELIDAEMEHLSA